MSRPKAYEPEQGYMYQLFVMFPGDRSYEHCDYAVDQSDKRHLLNEYRIAYGSGCRFHATKLPKEYWPKDKE